MLGKGPGPSLPSPAREAELRGFPEQGWEPPWLLVPQASNVSRPRTETSTGCVALCEPLPLGPQISHLQNRGLNKISEVPSGSLALAKESLTDLCPEGLGSEARAKDSRCWWLSGCGHGRSFELVLCPQAGWGGRLLRGQGWKQGGQI